MKKLYVYADFDWLKDIELIGVLSYESLRGSDSYGFKFDNEWLKKYGNLFLSDDLNNYPGQQYTQPEKDIFGCFSDALPDRWGRTLLNRREQILAAEEKRSVRRLSSFDYLLGIDDSSRMGGFRFKETPDGDFYQLKQHTTNTAVNQYPRVDARLRRDRKKRTGEPTARQKMACTISSTGLIARRSKTQSKRD